MCNACSNLYHPGIVSEAPMTINRGADSVRVTVRQRKDAPHHLKSHFRGCLREVVGYFDRCASKHPNRCIYYAGLEPLLNNCKRYQKDGQGRHYEQSMVLRCLRLLEQWGILTWQPWMQNRILNKGWVMAAHDA